MGQKSEGIEINDDTNNCVNFDDYPIVISESTGVRIKDKVIICGGFNQDRRFFYRDDYEARYDRCYIGDQNGFKFLTRLPHKIAAAASLVYNDRMWLTGGSDPDKMSRSNGYNSKLKATYYINLEGEITRGPDMPWELMNHVVLNINSTHAMVIGTSFGKTWYFNHMTQNFTEGPSLRIPRKSHTAGLIRDTVTKEVYVAVVGGYKNYWLKDDHGPTRSTEILRNDKWFIVSKDCQNILVNLENGAFDILSSHQGIYRAYQTVNGKTSWISTSTVNQTAIWYIPEYKDWAIGYMKNIGGKIRQITSTSNNETDSPTEISSENWKYYNEGWKKPTQKWDIIVKCIDTVCPDPNL